MRFMMSIYPGPYEEEWEADPADAAAMMAYNEELARAGVLLALDGLHPPSSATIVSRPADGGRVVVKDGPFVEAKELIGGYWVIDVKSQDEAVAWATRCPIDPGQTLEVRRIYEMSEYPEEVQAAANAVSLDPREQTRAR